MTLDEMESALNAEEADRAARLARARSYLSEQVTGPPHMQIMGPTLPSERHHSSAGGKDVITSTNARSLACEINSHGSCNWFECKCVCHDSSAPGATRH